MVEAPNQRHSALLILDNINRRAYFYDPCSNTQMTKHLATIIQKFLAPIKYRVTLLYVNQQRIKYDVSHCDRYGYCMAYVIREVLKWNKLDYMFPSDVQEFVNYIETEYGPLEGDPDISYALSGGEKGALIGGLSGLAIGGLAGGNIQGALIGGGLGALGGYLIGSSFS